MIASGNIRAGTVSRDTIKQQLVLRQAAIAGHLAEHIPSEVMSDTALEQIGTLAQVTQALELMEITDEFKEGIAVITSTN